MKQPFRNQKLGKIVSRTIKNLPPAKYAGVSGDKRGGKTAREGSKGQRPGIKRKGPEDS
ncbi:MAG: hypothetical protein HYX75_04055 [Acidobacteria bacterium]|nr:hypothetical protein [Acidobacteriota bacterium]